MKGGVLPPGGRRSKLRPRKFHVKQANPRNNTFYDFSRNITHFMISTYFLLKSYIGPGGVFGGPGGGLGGPGGGFRTRKIGTIHVKQGNQRNTRFYYFVLKPRKT